MIKRAMIFFSLAIGFMITTGCATTLQIPVDENGVIVEETVTIGDTTIYVDPYDYWYRDVNGNLHHVTEVGDQVWGNPLPVGVYVHEWGWYSSHPRYHYTTGYWRDNYRGHDYYRQPAPFHRPSPSHGIGPRSPHDGKRPLIGPRPPHTERDVPHQSAPRMDHQRDQQPAPRMDHQRRDNKPAPRAQGQTAPRVERQVPTQRSNRPAPQMNNDQRRENRPLPRVQRQSAPRVQRQAPAQHVQRQAPTQRGNRPAPQMNNRQAPNRGSARPAGGRPSGGSPGGQHNRGR